MEKCSVLLVCIVVACSVWIVRRGSYEVNNDTQELVDMSVKASKLPGVCWACNWALKEVKKLVKRKATVEELTSLLNSVCDKMGILKSLCRKMVKAHLQAIINKIRTTEDVRQICVDIGTCKPEELLDLHFYDMDKLK